MTKAKVKTTGGGRFDPKEDQVYFIAGSADGLDTPIIANIYRWNLLAVNELFHSTDELEKYIACGNKVLLDSGIFWLTNAHKRAHAGMTMNEALSLAPEDVMGFEKLWARYVEIIELHKDDLWGYIELDQGGAENKKRTRARLEGMGLAPIPVYHPLNDGWDYFDELCSRYDRICFGNVVQASSEDRRRLLATLWERKRRYPDVWVHVLGYTPNALTTVYPSNSYDSFSLMGALKWGQMQARSMGSTFGRFGEAMIYSRALEKDEPGGYSDGRRFIGSEAFFLQAVMREHAEERAAFFGPGLWPPYYRKEPVPAPARVKVEAAV